MKTKLIILVGILLIFVIVPLSGCTKEEGIRDIGVGEQLFYLYDDEYAYMDARLKTNDDFTPKLMHNLFNAEELENPEV
ncbi:MAG: hypothetical protein PF505_00325 [Vallitaleaceae bacterium]|jgi:ABC-type oligopeptide transport system substrate-binding subunit|nr:hypothetical protein [Vallitaleaceae bacterium]